MVRSNVFCAFHNNILPFSCSVDDPAHNRLTVHPAILGPHHPQHRTVREDGPLPVTVILRPNLQLAKIEWLEPRLERSHRLQPGPRQHAAHPPMGLLTLQKAPRPHSRTRCQYHECHTVWEVRFGDRAAL
jgi:hypothetical protein